MTFEPISEEILREYEKLILESFGKVEHAVWFVPDDDDDES